MKRIALLPALLSLIFSHACSAQIMGESYVNSLGMKMLQVSPGEFMMGSDLGRDYWDESPVHKVTISQRFYMSEIEVRSEAFKEFRADYRGNSKYEPYATAVSWFDAVEFCKWLSAKEGRTYRLPTEAEWEYACRSGTTSLYSSGDAAPEQGQANSWGIKNMHTGVREWCLDWYGEYSAGDKVDPVGPASGMAKVVRGGPLDDGSRDKYRKIFSASSSRASIAPAFGPYPLEKQEIGKMSPGQVRQGLIGTWFEKTDLSIPRGIDVIDQLYNNWINDGGGERGRQWSATWTGYIEAPYSGQVTFEAEAAHGCILNINSKDIINIWDGIGKGSGSIAMVKGKKYPISVSYVRQGRESFINVSWQWQGQSKMMIPAKVLSYTHQDWAKASALIVEKDERPGLHNIGFRIVLADEISSKPEPEKVSYARLGVKQDTSLAKIGPDMTEPYFRKRHLLPTPLDNCTNEEIDAVGMHRSFRSHCHSPGLEVCPNGDVMMVIYTSYSEYEPGVSLIASRLRFGADRWDMPERLFDFAAVNDHCPLLWTEGDKMYFFWGNPKLEGGFPFQWITSDDNGASWSEVTFPKFIGKIGSHSRQPINTVVRDNNGTIYVSSDASGGRSVLWASGDKEKTWYDTVGRTGGRHTTFAMLSDGKTILGMGGKSTDIDGFMPKSISKDGGRTWEVSKTPFAAQGGNQRPSIIRLQSGRLFFAGDFQHISGKSPEGIRFGGSYVALSYDDGETWKIEPLPGAQRHENMRNHNGNATIGYSAARQAPNGMIHLITTMNRPCLHFEFNESWILGKTKVYETGNDYKLSSKANRMGEVKKYTQNYDGGKLHVSWAGGIADDGRFLIHGDEIWYYPDGSKQRQASYDKGQKVGKETFWDADGSVKWTWDYNGDGASSWTQYWPNGNKKATSNWRKFMCEGAAITFDADGKEATKMTFRKGRKVE